MFYFSFLQHTGPDNMYLRSGEDLMVLRQKTRMITKSEEYLWRLYSAVYNKKGTKINVGSTLYFVKYPTETHMKLMVSTQVHTPFTDIYSNPKFRLVFDHRTRAPHSWVDVMISAKSHEKSEIIKSGNCLDLYHLLRESIFLSRTGSYKMISEKGNSFSMLLNLEEHDQKQPAKFKIKLITTQRLLKTKFTTLLHLNWTSHVDISRDLPKKAIALPGVITTITMETLYFIKNYTVNLHWIPMFARSSFKPSDVSLCNKKLLSTTNYTYCLDYTLIQKNYIFYWNIYRYKKCTKLHLTHIQRLMIFNPKQYYRILRDFSRCEPSSNKGTVAKSWVEASVLCKSIGGILPIIRNRDELDELITFLKLSEHMPPVEALYIGLRRGFKTQVTFIRISSALL